MGALKDLIGLSFGRLTVIGRAPSVTTLGGTTKACWICNCICGVQKTVQAGKLLSGQTKSCGCLMKEVSRFHRIQETKHGHTSGGVGSPTYRSWRAMSGRCHNPAHKDYPKYGGAGIRVCPQWCDFTVFLGDMGPRPEGKTLDRFPDTLGDYKPDNCRWATPKEQSRNQKSNKLNPELAHKVLVDPRPQRLIADDYGLSQSGVSCVKSGRTWA